MSKLRVLPCDLADANAFVGAHHRHHAPVVGHRFSLACVDEDGCVCGVCIVGRPVARMAGSKYHVCEVTRLCTDGTRNACSMLYGAAARTAKAMGFARIQTYTLPEEGGASLRGAGWRCEGEAGGGDWNRPSQGSRRTDQPMGVKHRWALALSNKTWPIIPPARSQTSAQQDFLYDAAVVR